MLVLPESAGVSASENNALFSSSFTKFSKNFNIKKPTFEWLKYRHVRGMRRNCDRLHTVPQNQFNHLDTCATSVVVHNSDQRTICDDA